VKRLGWRRKTGVGIDSRTASKKKRDKVPIALCTGWVFTQAHTTTEEEGIESPAGCFGTQRGGDGPCGLFGPHKADEHVSAGVQRQERDGGAFPPRCCAGVGMEAGVGPTERMQGGCLHKLPAPPPAPPSRPRSAAEPRLSWTLTRRWLGRATRRPPPRSQVRMPYI